MADKRMDTLKVAGVGLAGLAVFALVGYLLWKMASGLGKAFDGLGDGVGDLGEGAGQLLTGAGDVLVGAGKTTSVVGGFLHPSSSGPPEQAVSDFKANLPSLELVVVSTKNTTPGIAKKTEVRVRVVDRATRRNVPADVHFWANHAPNRFIYPTRTYLYNGLSDLTINYQVANEPGIEHEDDFTLWATAPGYNASSRRLVK